MIEAKEKEETGEQLPKIIRPMKPVKVETLPKNESDWMLEIKWDGARAIVYTNRNLQQFQIQSSSGRDISQQFPEFGNGLEILAREHSTILDSEIVSAGEKIGGERGTGSKVLGRLSSNPPNDLEIRRRKCQLFIFDLLYLDGQNLCTQPLVERKRLLAKLLTKHFQNKHGIVITPYWNKNHKRATKEARKQGFEGVVLKRKNSTYYQGQSKSWLKIKF